MSGLTNATRISRQQSREAQMIALLTDHPQMKERDILRTLAKRWGVSETTVAVTLKYLRRKSVIVLERVWSVKNYSGKAEL